MKKKSNLLRVLFIVFLSLISAFATVIYSWLWGLLGEGLHNGEQTRDVVVKVVLSVALTALCTFIRSCTQSYLLSGKIVEMQTDTVNTILKSSSMNVRQQSVGDYLSRMSVNLEEAASLCVRNRWDLIATVISFLIYAVFLTLFHWRTAIFAFAAGLVVFFLIPPMMRCLTSKRKEMMDAAGRAMAMGNNYLDNLQLIYTEGCREWAMERYDMRLHEVEHTFRRIIVLLMSALGASHLLTIIPSMIVIVYPCVLCVKGQISLSSFVSVLSIGLSMSSLLSALVQVLERRSSGNAAMQRINEIKQMPEEAGMFDGRIQIDSSGVGDGAIASLQDITYSVNDRAVLEHLYVNIHKGKTYLLVGPNGSGKTTFARVLHALYPPTSGCIVYYADKGMRQIPQSYRGVRRLVSMAEQMPFISEMSIEENLSLGKEIQSDNLLIALKKLRIYKLLEPILQSHEKDETLFAKELSGGQRKCISIARTILSESEVMIFDEPTANIDKESAKLIRDELAVLSEQKEKTIIIITHDDELKRAFSEADPICLGGMEKNCDEAR